MSIMEKLPGDYVSGFVDGEGKISQFISIGMLNLLSC